MKEDPGQDLFLMQNLASKREATKKEIPLFGGISFKPISCIRTGGADAVCLGLRGRQPRQVGAAPPFFITILVVSFER